MNTRYLSDTAASLFLVLAFGVSLGAPLAAQNPIFVDVAPETGLDFRHWNGMTGEYFFIEMTGQGGAFLDYDNDGDLDVFIVQGSKISDKPALEEFKGGELKDRLFRNDLDQGKGLKFTDVTDASGINSTGYGMGVSVGDIDNDGYVDIYVTNFGANQLWKNQGDGTFVEVGGPTGTADELWSTSAAFFDYDADGFLDLYVTNYVEWSLERNPKCYATSSRRDYCGPSAFAGQPDRLFRNRGDGRFEDVTARVLPGYEAGASLGIVSADLNGDKRLDLYVANDGEVNQLWLQQENGTFLEEALFSGVAVNRTGSPEASMGIDAGDVDNDGDQDLVLAHLMGETNTLYVNDGAGLFEDRSVESNLGAPSISFTSFGAGFLDFDNDGWLDLLMVSGAVRILEDLAIAGDPYPLDQTNQLFRNQGAGIYEDVTERAGKSFHIPEVSRGAAFGDVDNDGAVDILVANNNGPARLLLNQADGNNAGGNAWVGLRLVDHGRDALGAVATIQQGKSILSRRARTDGSYCSANDPRVTFGLGASDAKTVTVEVTWPDGTEETFADVPVGTYTTLTRKKDGPKEKPKETEK